MGRPAKQPPSYHRCPAGWKPYIERTHQAARPKPLGKSLQVTALGRSKASHEFLVLHYFGLDSAMHWDVLMSDVLPAVQLPGASARRATALEMFGAAHIPPSHRRMPHVLWTDSMTLIWSLLMGGRMGRYTGSPDTLVLDQRIDLRVFSAGSFAGLNTLQLLWKIPNVVINGKLGASLSAATISHPTGSSYSSPSIL